MSRHPLASAVEAAFANGADWLQLRERELEGAAWLDWAHELSEAARRGAGPTACVIVNRRLDIALAIEAQGAHLGFDAVALPAARQLLGPSAMIGVSAHSAAEVESAARAGASYAHLAPIFAPLSKPASRPPLGTRALSCATAHDVAVIAQGGATQDNARELIEHGAAGIAVTGTILLADDPAAATRGLRAALDAGPAHGAHGVA